ncbi:MAG: RecQ family ATP-dependent DNA helicase, partial [Gammaproteobacteria bacterium]
MKTTDAIAVLHDVFGFTDYRPGQKAVIEHVLSGGDALVVMATGAGKSLCYQLPALARPGTGWVISPLVALMEQQQRRLHAIGVRAACLHSGMSWQEEQDVLAALSAGAIDILFTSPERAMSWELRRALQRIDLSVIAIDEAHCIWQWGFDFRPEYARLGEVLDAFPRVPKVALTATASPDCQQAILDKLGLHDARTFIGSVDRPNLFLWMQPRQNAAQQLYDFICARHRQHAGIVYCQTRREVEQITLFLKNKGLSVVGYHAGLDAEQRRRVEQLFLDGDVPIIVATIAFGMGVDKPNVRFVAHLGIPRSVEAYYQEIGRAGRDGRPADAWLLYGVKDIQTQLRWLADSNAPSDRKRRNVQFMRQMVGMATTHECRRKHLLAAFGETSTHCGHCDNCAWPRKAQGAKVDAQKALSTIYRTGQANGIGYLVKVLRGARAKIVFERGHHHLSVYGIGREHNTLFWQQMFIELWRRHYVRLHGDYKDCLALNDSARQILTGDAEFHFVPPRYFQRRHYYENPLHNEIIDESIVAPLRDLRRQLADQHGLAPYQVFDDVQLHQIATL